ncbi:hypothetical protein [Isachenkonia alkalipeptolytica]|uniref:Lipocalin-like domain-containing protein n=1 Tax=Isachenkonia alkalipeptolytica TaxID=2565777 RepID=A0AA43XHT2_9CLOT|nr:hypothetical protein [Isachenkonia alkalipeptolytica]NBG86872.1 hypothetical protein [Isachenkonia alkalipeptolytica]
MKRLIYLSIIATVILMLTGCTTQSLPTNVEGQWDLETIFNESGEILSVGKAYNNYDDWGGQKEDIGIIFNKDNTFETKGFEKNLLGKYNKNQELSTKDAIAINMDIDNGTEIIATYGIRQYQDGEEVDSLIFTVDKKIYSFIKPITN